MSWVKRVARWWARETVESIAEHAERVTAAGKAPLCALCASSQVRVWADGVFVWVCIRCTDTPRDAA